MKQGSRSLGLLIGFVAIPASGLAADCTDSVPVKLGMDMPAWEVNYYFVDEEGREFKCKDPEPSSKVYDCEKQRVHVESEWRLYTFSDIVRRYAEDTGREKFGETVYRIHRKIGAAIARQENPFGFERISIRNKARENVLASESRSYRQSGSSSHDTSITPDCRYEVSRSVFEFGIPVRSSFLIESRHPMRQPKSIDMPDGIYVMHTGTELAHFPILEIKDGLVYRSSEDPHQEGDYRPLNKYQASLRIPGHYIVFTYNSRLSAPR